MKLGQTLAIAVALVAASTSHRVFGQPAGAESDASWYATYVRDSRLVELPGGRLLNLYCVGSGSPTVVLESGIAGSAFDWRSVQSRIAQRTRVCAYDRAGLGRSPVGPFPRDTRAQVADLEALLAAAKVRPPYVLVGHSMGGFNVRLFASRHQAEVVGLVLVDPSAEHQIPALYAAAPAIAGNDERQLKQLRACADPARTQETAKNCTRSEPEGLSADLAATFAKSYGLDFFRTVLSEAESFISVASDQVEAERRPLGSMPLLVLTRGNRSSNLPADQAEAEWALVSKMHREIARLSTAGVARVIAGADHYIQLDKPEVVISAVTQVLSEARRRHGEEGTATSSL